ncbi:MAG: hypothetical protein AMJ61_15845 [Desulfobacterales bacterium SG8_35_2]|nr:MAG: hypothetical protein AMJ61_15845 [Desulfobacterales bacterium SG8_35_2]
METFCKTNIEDGRAMANNDCSCWKITDCESPKDCPDKCVPGKTCWEVSFMHNSWEKVFEKCRDCKVFQRKITKSSKLDHH